MTVQPGDTLNAVLHQDDVGRFESDIRAHRAHGDADVRMGQSRCVVDAITNEHHCAVGLAESLGGFDLVFGVEFGVEVVELQLGSQLFGDSPVVSRKHLDSCHALGTKFSYAFGGSLSHGVLEGKQAHRVVDEDS